MKKQTLQNSHINTPKLEPSLYSPDIYVRVSHTDYFVEFKNLSVGEKQAFVDKHLDDFEEIFKLAVKEAIARRLESAVFNRSKIDTAKSIVIPSKNKNSMSGREEFERNVAAFKAMESQLKNDPKYQGKYVVIYKGQLVASGDDPDKLLSDAYQKFGYVSLLVNNVGEREKTRVYSLRYRS